MTSTSPLTHLLSLSSMTKLSRVPAPFPGKWVSRISELLISLVSLIVFFVLDILDVIMCMFFRVVDGFLEGKPSSCYCLEREKCPEEEQINALGIEGENELSESLHGRKNFIREMGLVKISRTRSENGSALVAKGKSWSDCGCESCVSWMNRETDSRLHVVVRQAEQARLVKSSEEERSRNVIFIHGFLSSSSVWKEVVFPNLSEHSKQKYNLYAVDLLGFGQSPKPRDCLYTLQDHLEMIEKSVINPFQLKTFHLVAHSMGCSIAVALAARHPTSVKSISLVAPPYFSSSREDVGAKVLNTLAARRVWPPLMFGSAFMSWYEHLGRCFCFFICRNHRTWEWILKLVTRKRELHFAIVDMTRHTHHSAWHTMHNVICGTTRFMDKYLENLRDTGVRIHVLQGTKDQVVPVECSFNMKMKVPEMELETIVDGDHNSVIFGREKEFTRNLENLWGSAG